jgi:hypothetical protein
MNNNVKKTNLHTITYLALSAMSKLAVTIPVDIGSTSPWATVVDFPPLNRSTRSSPIEWGFFGSSIPTGKVDFPRS